MSLRTGPWLWQAPLVVWLVASALGWFTQHSAIQEGSGLNMGREHRQRHWLSVP